MKKLTALLMAVAMVTVNMASVFAETDSTASPTPTGTTAPTATSKPTDTQEPTPTPAPTGTPIVPVYVIKNGEGSNIMLTYKEGKFSSEKMISNSNKTAVSLLHIEWNNYVPFRYLFEKFGIAEANKKCKIDEKVEEKTLDNADLETFISSKNKENPTEKVSGAYVWQQVGDDNSGYKINIRVLTADGKSYDLEQDKPISGVKDDDGNAINLSVRYEYENESTYIPLRALQLIGLDTKYDAETDAIFISQSKEDAEREAKKAYKSMFNDNYATYAYMYAPQPGKVSEKEYDKQRCYGVNQYGNMLVYVDNNQKVRVRFNDTKEDNYVQYRNEESFIADKIIYDGRKLYGIKVNNVDDAAGTIFSATLSVNNAGEFIATDIKEWSEINARYILFKTIKTKNQDDEDVYNRYLYFIDYDDSESIKRIGIDDDPSKKSPEPVFSASGTALTKISHFDIEADANGDYYMIYNNYIDKKISIAKVDENNTTNIKEPFEPYVAYDVNGMISDSNADPDDYIFYFIRDNGDNTNTVVGIKVSGDNYYAKELNSIKGVESAQGVKIRNIALINGTLYGRIIEESSDCYRAIYNKQPYNTF